jgi:hypothetical protein
MPRAIAAGNNHAVVVQADGTVIAWGDGLSGQLAVPADLTDVTAIACSGYATIAVRGDGSAVSFGGGTNPANGPTPVPAYAQGLQSVVAKQSIAVGVRRSVSNPSDLNGDGVVGAADLGILLSAWGSFGTGDIDGDGVVGAADLGILLSAWD